MTSSAGEQLMGDPLRLIMNYLDTPHKAHSASLVCARWADSVASSEWYLSDAHFKRPLQSERSQWTRLHVKRLFMGTEDTVTPVLAAYAREQDDAQPPETLNVGCEMSTAHWRIVSGMAAAFRSMNVVTFSPLASASFSNLQHLTCNAIPKASCWDTLGRECLTGLALSHVSDAALQQHIHKFPSVTSLSLVSCDSVTRHGFVALSKAPLMHTLEQLDLSSTIVDSFSLRELLKNCRKITHLHLNDCTKLNDDDSTATLPPQPSSSSPALHADPSAAPLSAPAAAAPAAAAAAAAPTQGSMVSSLFAELRAKTKRVPTHVPKVHRDEADAAAASADGAPPGADDAGGDDEGFGLDEHGHFFCGASVGSVLTEFPEVKKRLEVLSLSGVGKLDDLGVHMVFENLPCLRRVRLSKNREITDEAFAVALPPRLQWLSVSSCSRLTDAALRNIADSAAAAGLTSLSLSNCGGMSPAGVQYLVERCPALTSLNMFMMSQKHTVPARMQGGPSRLVDDETVRLILTKLPLLQQLCVSFQPLTHAAFDLGEGVQHLHLRDLEADMCAESPSFYAPLVHRFPSLTKLSLQAQRVPVPEAVLSELLAAHPLLTSLKLCIGVVRDVVPFAARSKSLQLLDLEYSGEKEAFEVALWWKLMDMLRARHARMFVGRWADKLMQMAWVGTETPGGFTWTFDANQLLDTRDRPPPQPPVAAQAVPVPPPAPVRPSFSTSSTTSVRGVPPPPPPPSSTAGADAAPRAPGVPPPPPAAFGGKGAGPPPTAPPPPPPGYHLK
eukprot:Rhum_TRINITY_DN14603_c11_g1::Rhum_TRINITY_DN14603_c11_g1_i2::g.103901::m.103901